MAQVSKLAINHQIGSDNTFYASWTFDENTGGSKTTSSSIKAGNLVTIKAGSKYYNGVDIPDWVEKDTWYVVQVKGDRAVLGKNKSGSNNIQSPVNVKYLSNGTTTTSSSKTKTLDHYEVQWHYATGNGLWFSGGGTSNVTEKSATYSPPENAYKFKVTVKPVSKTYKEGDKEKSYWSGSSVSAEYYIAAAPPDVPPAPSITIEKYKLTAVVNNVTDARTDSIQFQVYKDDDAKVYKSDTRTVQTARATYTCDIAAGGKYRVRCRAVNKYNNDTTYSDWTAYSEEKSTIPLAVTNVKCSADSKTSVKVTWTKQSTATGYDIQYSTNKLYFDTSSQVSSTSVGDTNTAYVTGLESGETWYFRVRAINAQGESGWSSIVSTVIGTKPEPPTTWSLTTTAVVGEELVLYWVHNSEDGSKQSSGQIELDINGTITTVDVPGITNEDEDEPIYSYRFSSASYTEGAKIKWKVRTKGVVAEWSDWSAPRVIDIYAPPVLTVTTSADENGVLTSLPFNISATAGPVTQDPISYHVAITATSTYETTDIVGSNAVVTAGTDVYSTVFNVTDRDFELSLSAGDVLLQNGESYQLSVTVAMDSGLTSQVVSDIHVTWDTYDYRPDASIGIDMETLTAYITPFCMDLNEEEEEYLTDDVTLSVYRREHNGTFTELASGLANTGVDTVTDPHPSLDYARYRIVAIHAGTGSVSYEDLPGEPVGETSIVIQWDEAWSNYDYTDEDEPETPPWTGSMLRFPYNVDISENYDPDATLVKYIGREHPVTYYGTQRGESASWSAAIPATDKETIYGLRRLASWRGNVYVREPSGTGYWAKVKVTFPQKHNDLTVPVTFDITRVEGDV